MLFVGSAAALHPLAAPPSRRHRINGIDANYPPFAYVDDGKPAGFDVDSMNWIAKKMGLPWSKPMDWDGIIPALLAKKIDMVCSGMSIAPNARRRRTTRPLLDHPQDFITKGSQGREDRICNGRSGSASSAAQRAREEMLQKAQAEALYNYQLRFCDSAPWPSKTC